MGIKNKEHLFSPFVPFLPSFRFINIEFAFFYHPIVSIWKGALFCLI